MHIKIIFNGLLHHRKKGKKLFILISLSVTAIILLLSLSDSFYRKYRAQGIDTMTGHLAIVSPDSPRLRDAIWGSQSQKLSLIRPDATFMEFLKNIPEVAKAVPVIETQGQYFSLDGESFYGYPLKGIRNEDFKLLFPGIRLIGGTLDFAYKKGMDDIPVMRVEPRGWEASWNSRFFIKRDFIQPQTLESLKKILHDDFLSQYGKFSLKDIEGESGTLIFMQALNELIRQPDLHKRIPEKYLAEYNWRIDDAVFELEKIPESGLLKEDIPFWGKRLIQAIYPLQIAPVREGMELGRRYSLAVPAAKNITKLSSPEIIPVKVTAYIEVMPLFSADSFIDLNALQDFLGLDRGEYTGIFIRLTDLGQTEKVKTRIDDYISANNLNYKVIDYKFAGKAHLPIATAMEIILTILIILFLITIIFFIINMVSLSIIKRRQEIGTSISMGMTNREIILAFTAEVFIMLIASWIFGSLLGIGLMILLQYTGISGIVFLQNKTLYFIFNIRHIFTALMTIIPPAVIATVLCLLPVRKMKAVELLRETN